MFVTTGKYGEKSAQEFSIGPEQIDALYHYAKFQFECGNYSAAAEFLYHYRTLSTDNERNMSALWGKLAAEILMQNWCALRRSRLPRASIRKPAAHRRSSTFA